MRLIVIVAVALVGLGALGPTLSVCSASARPQFLRARKLVYFAAYPSIADVCAAAFAGATFSLETSTRFRDVCYFANCDPDDALTFRLHEWAPAGDGIRFTSTFSRRSDGVATARVTTVKAFV